MDVNCLEILGLSYQNILNNLSLAFENEKFITISGPNNCGKTTLIRIIGNEISISNSIIIYGQKQEDYKITDLANIVRTIIPLEITFIQETVEEELLYQLPSDLPKDIRKKTVKDILKKFKLTKLSTTSVERLSDEEIIRLQLALAAIKNPKIIMIDNLSPYFSKKELLDLVDTIKEINKEDKVTIIMITSNLDVALKSDYLYVINNHEIIIEGNPTEVLEKDNILNKAGLNLPFMMDLSVKLRDYDLIKEIELDMDRMVDTLWN